MQQPILLDRMKHRIAELRAESEVGHKMVAQLESQQANLQRTLLRIGGAIDALEELVRAPASEDEDKLSRVASGNGAPPLPWPVSSETR